VRVLDRIRFELCARYRSSEDFAEFTWFAREYPRCYRYHFECAEYRLRGIYSLFCEIHKTLAPQVTKGPALFGASISDLRVQRIYWDFESYLSEVNIAIDMLARVAGTAYAQPMSPNFNKFCKQEGDGGLLGIMKRAQVRWVKRMKDYRDCFTHYTPVDTLLFISLIQYSDGFQIRGRLPINPNVREIQGFRFARQVELLRYAFSVWRHMTALDRAVAGEIARAFVKGDFPKRTSNLFFLGRRQGN
jgi:hypothetical protein